MLVFMSIKGVTKRWIIGALWISIVVLPTIVIGFTYIFGRYLYNNVEQNILGRAEEFSNVFRYDFVKSHEEFKNKSILYINDVQTNKNFQISICDEYNILIVSSEGSWNDNYKFFKDSPYGDNKNEKDMWFDYLPNGEHIITLTCGLFNSSGEYFGSIKYISSLNEIDNKIAIVTLLVCILCIVTALCIIIMGISFIDSVIIPVTKITNTAKLIALGNFSIKINKKYNDEIGELCDSINYMAEELGTAERMKNDFISSVSHEIRTPLTAVKGWAETMQIEDEMDRSVIKKGLDIIVHETERLSGIVEELLDFSRLQSGRMIMSMDKLDILAELGEAVYMFRERASSESKTLIYNEPKMLPPILGDRNRLRQVFINVIDNALKYTSEGGGVSVSIVQKENGICVSVTDNGCGISKDHLPRITEKFYKANTVQRGSGIGLAIVSEIIEMHKGTLEILSEEGFGTTVNIYLPIIKEDIEFNPKYQGGIED